MMRISRKKLILISLIALICIILLLSVIYHQTALWKPEQSLITLLPESPICYLTLKGLEDVVKTFNRSELGKQAAQMPILSHIKNQLWWQQLVYQKWVWETEMGGKLDMRAVKGHFGKEAIFALYQRDGDISFLLITEVGGPEKLAIEAITATDAINPRYKRIQTEYNGLTINTITGYPLDFSYTFIGKIGVLCLNPLLLAEVIDIYAGKKSGFLAQHPIEKQIQESYDHDTNTGYLDVPHFSSVLQGLEANSLVGLLSPRSGKTAYYTLGNRYEEGVIISRARLGNPGKLVPSQPETQRKLTFLPEKTALVTFNPHHDWRKLWKTLKDNLAIEVETDNMKLSDRLGTEMTLALVSHSEGEVLKIPSLILHAPIQDKTAFVGEIEELKNREVLVAGKPLEFLETQDYKGITVQPVQLRFNVLLAITGGYAVVDNNFFFSTTLAGLKSVLDTNLGDAPELPDVTFSANEGVVQTFIQPNLLIPEIKRFLPIITLLVSLSGQTMDAKLTQHITDNLFPLESLGPITANVHFGKDGVDAEVRIVLESDSLQKK